MTWTISSLLDWTTQYFKNQGIECPHLEAEILLAHALGVKRISLYVQHERALNEEELAAFKKLILRRVKKEPIAYIIGYKPFMSLDFEVSPEVLIPRPETEKLVEVAIDLIKGNGLPNKRVLDIGTGSGAIAVSLAKYADTEEVHATDISEKAIETAKANAEKHSVSGKMKFYPGDIFSGVPSGTKFGLVISNPPYIPSANIEKLDPDVKNFEPKGALDGGPDGLDFYRKILSNIENFLDVGGYLIFEAEKDASKKIQELIKEKGIFDASKTFEDNLEIERVVTARRTK
jgi:release factor glutamine methyltransferase